MDYLFERVFQNEKLKAYHRFGKSIKKLGKIEKAMGFIAIYFFVFFVKLLLMKKKIILGTFYFIMGRA